jgi:hypothetical protein
MPEMVRGVYGLGGESAHSDWRPTPFVPTLVASLQRLGGLYLNLNPLQSWHWIEQEVRKLWHLESVDLGLQQAALLQQQTAEIVEQDVGVEVDGWAPLQVAIRSATAL